MDDSLMNIDRRSSSPSLIKCDTLRIHPTSDLFEPTQNYIGLINYLTGDIYIKQSDWILKNIPQRRRQRAGNYLHDRLFYFIYRYWKTQNRTFIGRGFSYLNGEWKFLSRTLNAIDNDHRLNKFEEKLLQVIIDNLYINHRWVEMPPDHRIDCQGLAAMERNNKYISRVHPSNVHVNRKLHGTVKWLNNQRHRLGFIQCIGLDRDIYIHSTAILNLPSYSGKNIEFHIVQECHGWKAENITVIWP